MIGKWRDNVAPGAHEKVRAKSDDSDDEDFLRQHSPLKQLLGYKGKMVSTDK